MLALQPRTALIANAVIVAAFAPVFILANDWLRFLIAIFLGCFFRMVKVGALGIATRGSLLVPPVMLLELLIWFVLAVVAVYIAAFVGLAWPPLGRALRFGLSFYCLHLSTFPVYGFTTRADPELTYYRLRVTDLITPVTASFGLIVGVLALAWVANAVVKVSGPGDETGTGFIEYYANSSLVSSHR